MSSTPHPPPDDLARTGAGGAVLRLPAEGGAPVRIPRAAVVEALAAVPGVATVAFTDDPAEAAALAHALEAHLAATPGIASDGEGQDLGGLAVHAPVVDALKRVEGDLVRETVDRSALMRLVAPAVVRADVLRAALTEETDHADDDPDAVVHPLALVARTHRILPLPG